VGIGLWYYGSIILGLYVSEFAARSEGGHGRQHLGVVAAWSLGILLLPSAGIVAAEDVPANGPGTVIFALGCPGGQARIVGQSPDGDNPQGFALGCQPGSRPEVDYDACPSKSGWFKIVLTGSDFELDSSGAPLPPQETPSPLPPSRAWILHASSLQITIGPC